MCKQAFAQQQLCFVWEMHDKLNLVYYFPHLQATLSRMVIQYITDAWIKQLYIYITLFCPGRVLMVDIFITFRVQHYFRVQILAFSGQ